MIHAFASCQALYSLVLTSPLPLTGIQRLLVDGGNSNSNRILAPKKRGRTVVDPTSAGGTLEIRWSHLSLDCSSTFAKEFQECIRSEHCEPIRLAEANDQSGSNPDCPRTLYCSANDRVPDRVSSVHLIALKIL